MNNKKQATLTDYMVIAISPALIMIMVGSLVFYVIAVLCNGQFEARLCYIAALFVFASVLIARIAMEEGRAYASMYAFALGAAVLIVMGKFTAFGFPASVGIVLLILWCTDKLTWDCTLVDGSEDTSSQGLLQIAGLEKRPDADEPDESNDEVVDDARVEAFNPDNEGLVVAAMDNPDAAMREATKKAKSWWGKMSRRPNKPGVWVIYFALAALPIFGFLQWFIADDAKRWAFILLCTYLASGFGLLVNTSFLGLRQYLRNRNMEMPADMAAVWLGAGAAKIAALMLLIGALTFVIWMMPASKAANETSNFLTSFLPEDDPETNDMGFGNDGPDGEDADRTGPYGKESGDEDSQGKGGKDGDEGENGQGNGKEDDPKGKGDDGKEGEDGSGGKEKKDGDGKKGEQEGDKGKGDKGEQKSGGSGGSQSGKGSSGGKDKSSGGGQGKSKQQQNSQQQSQQQQQQSSSSFWSSMKWFLEMVFKFAFWLVVIVVALASAWYFRHEIKKLWQTIVEKLRALWAMLFGRKTEEEKAAAREPEDNEPPPRPFSDFTDPFKSGMVREATPEQVVEYCFAAFEAWAREHGCPRHPEKTPHEFVYAVGLTEPGVADAGQAVADLYCQAAFARGTLQVAQLQLLQNFWQHLEAADVLGNATV